MDIGVAISWVYMLRPGLNSLALERARVIGNAESILINIPHSIRHVQLYYSPPLTRPIGWGNTALDKGGIQREDRHPESAGVVCPEVIEPR